MISYEPPDSVWSESGTGIGRFGYTSMCRVELQSHRISARGVIGAQPTGDASFRASRLSR